MFSSYVAINHFNSQSAELDNCVPFLDNAVHHVRNGNIDRFQDLGREIVGTAILNLEHSKNNLKAILENEHTRQENGNAHAEYLKLLKESIAEMEKAYDDARIQLLYDEPIENQLLKDVYTLAKEFKTRVHENISVRGKIYRTDSVDYLYLIVRDGCRITNEFIEMIHISAIEKFVRIMRKCNHPMNRYVKNYQPIAIESILKHLVENTHILIFGNMKIYTDQKLHFGEIQTSLWKIVHEILSKMMNNLRKQSNEAIDWFKLRIAKVLAVNTVVQHKLHVDDVPSVEVFKNKLIDHLQTKIDKGIEITSLTASVWVTNADTLDSKEEFKSQDNIRKTLFSHYTTQYEALAKNINDVGERIFTEILSINTLIIDGPGEDVEEEEEGEI